MKSKDKSKPGDSRQADQQGKQNFVLVDTEHPEIDTPDVPELETRRKGNRQSGIDRGARQGERPGSEGGAPGEEASSGV